MAEETTKMQHPTLSDVYADVPTDYVPAHEAQGWVKADDKKPAKRAAKAPEKAEKAPEKAAEPKPDRKPRKASKSASRSR